MVGGNKINFITIRQLAPNRLAMRGESAVTEMN